ncbi:unnamed protein product [Toxocara canis]|uniref:Protein CUSTOS n=1 Tax=Toxocara canis TaxID=6265 RepID=A0A183UWY8_TOXCA|nr:unnamed protein product [Toxocara canis]
MGKKEDKSLSSSKGEVKKSTLTNGGGKDEVTDKFEATIFFLRTQEKMLKSHVGILNTIFVQRLDDKCKGKYIPAPIPTSIEFHSESESEEEYSDRATAGGGADECSASDSKKKSRENSSTQRQPSELLSDHLK